jgi:5,5'-dehydrodivanillate O-demethylase oxygenase subunit
MLTAEENVRLTRVGLGTPMGEMLRRYWHPVAALGEMEDRWTKRVRLLGEDLVLFKDRSGRFGLIGEFCPHRRASLAYGIPTDDGIRCPYHGWKFDGTGRCLEQPNEPEGSSFKDKVTAAGYPVGELGGLIWAYLGPLPAPLIPRLDGFVVAGAIRTLGQTVIPCNWLQIMENSIDPLHAEWLHGHFAEFWREKEGAKFAHSRPTVKIAFDEVPYGIVKRRLLLGQHEDCDDWRIGHPVVFPTTLALGNADEKWRQYQFQIRVPMDDTHTQHYWYNAFVPPPGANVPDHLLASFDVYDVPFRDEHGEFLLDTIYAQDIMVWTAQGPIADRTLERIGSSDRGVTLYRKMLQREVDRVERGEDPLGTRRDPAHDETIELPVERTMNARAAGFETTLRRHNLRYSTIAEDLVALFSGSGKDGATATR